MLITDLCKTGSAGLYNYIEFKRSQCYYKGDLGDKLFGSPQAGRISRHFLWRRKKKELSVFIDESGDFGDIQDNHENYLVTFVFHDQLDDISSEINTLEKKIKDLKLNVEYIHTGPIIRREGIFQKWSLFIIYNPQICRILHFPRLAFGISLIIIEKNVEFYTFFDYKMHHSIFKEACHCTCSTQ